MNGVPIEREDRVLILGSSPSMPTYADEAFEKCGVVLTTNAGIYECLYQDKWPYVYGVVEVATPGLFGRYYRSAVRSGTKILTIDLAVANDPGLGREADIVLDVCEGVSPGDRISRKALEGKPFVRGRYVACSATGGYLLQYAMNAHEPREVWLVGMEGYRSTPRAVVVDTFDGRPGNKAGEEWTRKLYAPLLLQVFDAFPETQFVVCGTPTYDLGDRANVRRYYIQPEEARLGAERIP